MTTQIQLRRGNASVWTSTNPILTAGEIGIELDTKRVKVGDGTTAWNSLPYSAPKASYQTTSPTNPITGDIWVDSDAGTSALNTNDYLLINDAASTYLTQTNASNTYLSQSTATSDYAKKSELGAYIGVPIGSIIPYAGISAPSNWLFCDGTQYNPGSVSTVPSSSGTATIYYNLALVIGTAFNLGTETAGYFRVPDMRGRVPAGLDNIGGADAGRLSISNTIGTATGSQTHTLTTSEMPSHTHIQNAHTHWISAGQYDDGNMSTTGISNTQDYGLAADAGSYSATDTNKIYGRYALNATAVNQNAGSDGSHNNMQPTMLFNYIIRYN